MRKSENAAGPGRRWIVGLALVGGLATGALGVGIAYAASSATVSTTDAVVTKTTQTPLSATGGAEVTINKLKLPAGKWIVRYDDTLVRTGPVNDDIRCYLRTSTKSNGHALQAGNVDPVVGTLSGTIALKLKSATTVRNTCAHDQTTGGGNYYVDPGATMWAHQSKSLTITKVK